MNAFQPPEWKNREARSAAYRTVFMGLEGEKVLQDIKFWTGFYRTSFNKDPLMFAFAEGQRSVAVALQNTIDRPDLPGLGEEEDSGE